MTQHKFNILALLFNGNAAAKQRELLREIRERAEKEREGVRERSIEHIEEANCEIGSRHGSQPYRPHHHHHQRDNAM